jgi:hypothetical protein
MSKQDAIAALEIIAIAAVIFVACIVVSMFFHG